MQERQAADRIRLRDRILMNSSTHVAAAMVTTSLGVLFGLPGFGCFLGGWLAGWWGLTARGLLIEHHYSRGLYRRTLAEIDQVLNGPGWCRPGYLLILKAECHLLLGEFDKAKEALQSIDVDRLPRDGHILLELERCFLFCSLQDPASAILILDELQADEIPAQLRSLYSYCRAVASMLLDDYDRVIDEVDQSLRDGITNLVPYCLSLKALAVLEKGGEEPLALAISEEALDRLDKAEHAPALYLNHAYVLLEATGNVAACRGFLEQVAEYEGEIGLGGKATLHYLLARTSAALGDAEGTRAHIELASSLPCRRRMKARILGLRREVTPRRRTRAFA